MKRECIKCRVFLGQDNPGLLCSPCQKERTRPETEFPDDLCYDAKEMASILGFDETESVMRLARKERLPPRIPNIKKYLWSKKVIHDWIDAEHRLNELDKAKLKALSLGWPVDQITSYGNDNDHLVKEIKAYEYEEREEPLPPELQDLDS